MFEQVTRKKAKLRLALTGVSGGGKTLGALYIAYGMTGDWSKVAVIDTEHERARFYADRSDLGTGSFLYAPFAPPYSPDRYKQLVQEAAEIVGSDGVVIIDSLSHAWAVGFNPAWDGPLVNHRAPFCKSVWLGRTTFQALSSRRCHILDALFICRSSITTQRKKTVEK